MARVAAPLPDRASPIATSASRAVRAREVAWLLVALAGLFAGWRAFRWGLDKADPRRAAVRAIRAEASPTRDIIVFTDEAPELIAAASPVPAVYGTPSLADVSAFRRVYVIAANEGALLPFEVRLGAPAGQPAANAMRWDVAGLGVVRFDVLNELLSGAVVAHRDGGAAAGPCTRDGARLRCHSPDDWNHLRGEDHAVGGATVRCLFAHPQADGRLVIEVPHLPRARALVGIVALDDRAYFAQGAAVTNLVVFEPDDHGPRVERSVVAANRRGAEPYRIDLGGHAGHLTFSITTPDAGARQYCFTAQATE